MHQIKSYVPPRIVTKIIQFPCRQFHMFAPVYCFVVATQLVYFKVLMIKNTKKGTQLMPPQNPKRIVKRKHAVM